MRNLQRSITSALVLCSAMPLLGTLSADAVSAQSDLISAQLAAGTKMPILDVNSTTNTIVVGHTKFSVTSETRFYDSEGNSIRMSQLKPVLGGGPGSYIMATTESRAVGSSYELISLKVISPLSD